MKKISTREATMIVVVLLIGLLVFAYMYYYQPLKQEGRALKTELSQKQEDYNKHLALIAGIPDMQKQAEETEKEIAEAFKNYYPELGISEYIVKVYKLTSQAGIDPETLSFQKSDEYLSSKTAANPEATDFAETNDAYGLRGVEFSIDFICTYDQFSKLIKLIDNSERIIVSNQLALSPLDGFGVAYSCALKITFLETYGLEDYVNEGSDEEEMEVLPEEAVGRTNLKNPFGGK